MKEDMKTMKAKSWTDDGFSLDPYDLVFLPGGHEKGVVQVINSPVTHRLMVDYFPKTRKPSNKTVAAICRQ
jgi:putative intracellular protease/amidase